MIRESSPLIVLEEEVLTVVSGTWLSIHSPHWDQITWQGLPLTLTCTHIHPSHGFKLSNI